MEEKSVNIKETFESERFLYREWGLDDAPIFFELNEDPEVMKYTGDIRFKDVEEARALIANYSAFRDTNMGRWLMVRKEDGAIVGWCGLKYHPEEDYVDLGYRLFKKYWGQGYATEGGLRCVQYGFEELGLKEIVGRTASDNKGSIRVLEKCGMEFWKKAPCEGIDDSLYYRVGVNYE